MDFLKLWQEIYEHASRQDTLSLLICQALEVIDCALDTHGVDNVSLSFNGGKDCTVLLYLFACACAKRWLSTDQTPAPLTSIYIPVPSPFAQLETFIDQCEKDYSLDLYRSPPTVTNPSSPLQNGHSREMLPDGADFMPILSPTNSQASESIGTSKGGDVIKWALEVYKSKLPNITAILIGTRSTDPHGSKLSFRNSTDPGWPSYERVNPIINWSYSDVWDFLLEYKISYCSLYDQGYTSLGSTYNTFPNPALLTSSSDSASGSLSPGTAFTKQVRYRPAHELRDSTLERAGRGKPSQVV